MAKKRKLQVRISAEANRFAETNLSSAYEILIPIIKHPMSANEKKASIEDDIKMEQSLVINGNLKW